jgi:hypothetical protein
MSLHPESFHGKSPELTESEDGVRVYERKWKHFSGNNRFYCQGRVMTAPSIRYFMFCSALILVTYSLFMVFE